MQHYDLKNYRNSSVLNLRTIFESILYWQKYGSMVIWINSQKNTDHWDPSCLYVPGTSGNQGELDYFLSLLFASKRWKSTRCSVQVWNRFSASSPKINY